MFFGIILGNLSVAAVVMSFLYLGAKHFVAHAQVGWTLAGRLLLLLLADVVLTVLLFYMLARVI